MNTLTIDLPETVDLAEARWELVRALYEKGELTLEEAAQSVSLAPTYFKMKLKGMVTGVVPKGTRYPAERTDLKKIEELAKAIDIQESWEELVTMIGK